MATAGGSPLVELLKDELAVQRTFLSTDEEVALLHPASYDDENDLAWDRVKHRRLVLFTALRERFIQDGRPLAEWQRLIADAELAAGEPTYISQLATQVLEWATRTSDRGAMLGGFASKTLRWLAILLVLLGAYGLYTGSRFGGAVFIGLGLALFVAGRTAAAFTSRRTAALSQHLRAPHIGAPDGTAETPDA